MRYNEYMENKTKYIKPRQYSKLTGIGYKTVIKMFYNGHIQGFQNPDTKSIYLNNPEYDAPQTTNKGDKAVIYARVSSSDNKHSLNGQIERCSLYASAKGLTVIDTKEEIASGLNENRRKLWSLLNRDDYDYLIVEHKDRLTRYGFSYIEAFCAQKNIEILVINEEEPKSRDEELLQDFVSIVTSFCSRIYGRKRKLKTKRIIEEIKNNE